MVAQTIKRCIRIGMVFTISALMCSGCYYDKVEDILGPLSCDTLQVTYSNTISPMLSQYCNNCHSGTAPSAGFSLTSYIDVKNAVNTGKLWGSMNHESGYSPMPKGSPKLEPCKLQQLRSWINKGSPNN